jgi:hypothetical protein
MEQHAQRTRVKIRGWRLVAGAAAIAIALGATTAVAAASGGTVQKTVNPKVANGLLVSVSCTTSTSCVGVGSHTLNSGTIVPLAEFWNGNAWTELPTPAPAGSPTSALTSVSCAGATTCQAVGYEVDGSTGHQLAIAEGWDGASWTIEATPNVSATFTNLDGVSCPSMTDCVAVGNRYNSAASDYQVLVETWNGAVWSQGAIAAPPQTTYSVLYGISCESTSACVAVGHEFDAAGTAIVPVVETFATGTWSLTSTALPPGATTAQLSGVSCQSGTCMLVGTQDDASGTAPLAEQLHNGAVADKPTPIPVGGSYDDLASVSCTSATHCFSVGSGDVGGSFDLFGEQWDGTSWSLVHMPTPGGAPVSALGGVSCPSSTACLAVGYHGSQAIAEMMWPTGKWVLVKAVSPVGTSGASLSSVSCVTASDCEAVGSYTNNVGVAAPVIEKWNGTKWAKQSAAVPTGFVGTLLTSVSCSSATFCEAVGYGTAATHLDSPFAEVWNGASWALQAVPSPSGAASTALIGVSCSSSTSCVAAGAAADGATNNAFVSTFDGLGWASSTVPVPAGTTYSVLSSVSCPSAASCTAVGYATVSGATTAIAERLSSSTWTSAVLPAPPGDSSTYLYGVSCTGATSCAAVGGASSGSTPVALAEVLTASGWTATEVDPSLSYGTLNGVSCTSSTSCTAVGAYSTASGYKPLAERFGGSSWSNASAPQPADSTQTTLSGVSCPSGASTCEAVGYFAYYGMNVTLGELLS